jgi:hypothetical protein
MEMSMVLMLMVCMDFEKGTSVDGLARDTRACFTE